MSSRRNIITYIIALAFILALNFLLPRMMPGDPLMAIYGEEALVAMTPQLKDLQDLWANVKYFLYMGPRPALDRWSYWEKFDYLAVFWGVGMIGVSGLMLWFPDFFTRFLPGSRHLFDLILHPLPLKRARLLCIYLTRVTLYNKIIQTPLSFLIYSHPNHPRKISGLFR